ncbi:MAG: sulfatase [Acidobacteriota bacterium]|nr:sulfatase [Acidobacteriota bacterium]
MKYILCIGILLLAACGKPESGRHFSLTSPKPVKLGLNTVASEAVTSPHRYEGLTSGRTISLQIGNTSARPITLTLEGAETPSLDLPPGRWTHLETRLTAADLNLSWPSGELRVGRLFQQGSGDKRPNVMLVSIDTLRADHFNAERMPQTFGLMSRGLIFDHAYTPTPWTLPAHVSMLTGQYPAGHGVRLPNQQIPAQLTTLGEAFQSAGYDTLAVTEGNYVSGTFGFYRGFSRFLENAPSMLDRDPTSISKLEANLEILREQLDPLPRTPKFVFFHTYEVHCPYLPRGGLTDDQGLGHTQWLLDNDGKFSDQETYDRLAALYAGEVAWLDRKLAPLLEELLATGNWIIALTSDHGEEFGEHGGLLHADTLYEETTRIPLAMAGPGIAPGRDDRSASLVDLPDTLAALTGLTPPETWRGRNLMDPARKDKALFAESFFFGPQIPVEDPRILSVWLSRDKLIQTRNFNNIRAELYDLAADPGETTNLQSEQQEKRDALFLFLERYLSGKTLDPGVIEGLSPEQIETMRSLGYIE